MERGKKDLTLSQLADALQVILERRHEALMSETQLPALAERLAADIERTQRRNRRARVAARRRRLRELAALGIDTERLPLCDEWAL